MVGGPLIFSANRQSANCVSRKYLRKKMPTLLVGSKQISDLLIISGFRSEYKRVYSILRTVARVSRFDEQSFKQEANICFRFNSFAND